MALAGGEPSEAFSYRGGQDRDPGQPQGWLGNSFSRVIEHLGYEDLAEHSAVGFTYDSPLFSLRADYAQKHRHQLHSRAHLEIK